MNPRRPPRLAVWLLNRFASIRENESFLGDLREEFHSGRSVGWYWRQTLTAVAVAIGKGSPNSGLSRAAAFIGCCISVIPVLVLLRLDVPFRSLQELAGSHRDFWPFILLTALTEGRKVPQVRNWMSSGRFSRQTFRWLVGYLAVDCVYLLLAGWIGWVGWGGMLIAKLVTLFRELIEMLGQMVRRKWYGARA